MWTRSWPGSSRAGVASRCRFDPTVHFSPDAPDHKVGHDAGSSPASVSRPRRRLASPQRAAPMRARERAARDSVCVRPRVWQATRWTPVSSAAFSATPSGRWRRRRPPSWRTRRSLPRRGREAPRPDAHRSQHHLHLLVALILLFVFIVLLLVLLLLLVLSLSLSLFLCFSFSFSFSLFTGTCSISE